MPVYDGLVTDFYAAKQKEHLCLPTIEVASIERSLVEFQISRAFLAPPKMNLTTNKIEIQRLNNQKINPFLSVFLGVFFLQNTGKKLRINFLEIDIGRLLSVLKLHTHTNTNYVIR